MTDDRRYRVIGKGRITFPDRIDHMFPGDEINLMRPRESTWRGSFTTEPFQMAKLADLLGHNPVPYLIGYDAQKLLPSPERVFREAVLKAFYDLHMDGEHVFYPPVRTPPLDEPAIRWKKAVIVVGDGHLDVHARIAAALAIPNVLGVVLDLEPSSGVLPGNLFDVGRWNHPDASPLDDIRHWRNQMQMLDRFDRVRPNQQLRMYAMGMMFDHPPAVQLAKKPQKSYLKHDPTKQHKRRRRK
jgi:hypothetical protein